MHRRSYGRTGRIEHEEVEELAFRVVGDMGEAFIMALGYIGDRPGLYKAMDDGWLDYQR